MEWFESWFSSPYYHILYKNRDDSEAARFIDNIIRYLDPAPNAKILDAACGKGRHSIYLNRKGFDVTGIDLSEPSIEIAKKHENKKLANILADEVSFRHIQRPCEAKTKNRPP